MSYNVHSLLPVNNRDSYSEFDTIDWVATCEGRKFVGNSFRISGKLRVNSTGTTRVVNTDQIYFDKNVGAHGFFESMNVEIPAQGGQKENLTGYGRYCGMVHDATQTSSDLMNSENVSELKCPLETETLLLATGEQGVGTNPLYDDLSFSFKPKICLNSCVGKDDPNDTTMSFKKTGQINVSVTLARNSACLFGNDMSAGTANYSLSDMRLEFLSVPEDNKANTVLCRTKSHIRQSILSGSSNVQAQVPNPTNSVSVSFVKTSNENSLTANHLRREVLPVVSELRFLFNNATNEYIQYGISEREEILMRYIDSMKDVKHSEMSLKNLAGNHAYGIGLSFGEFISLLNQTFNIQVNSGVTSATPYSAHLYFHGLESV